MLIQLKIIPLIGVWVPLNPQVEKNVKHINHTTPPLYSQHHLRHYSLHLLSIVHIIIVVVRRRCCNASFIPLFPPWSATNLPKDIFTRQTFRITVNLYEQIQMFTNSRFYCLRFEQSEEFAPWAFNKAKLFWLQATAYDKVAPRRQRTPGQ